MSEINCNNDNKLSRIGSDIDASEILLILKFTRVDLMPKKIQNDCQLQFAKRWFSGQPKVVRFVIFRRRLHHSARFEASCAYGS